MKRIIIAVLAFMTAFAAWSQEISRAITEGNLEKVVKILNDNPGLLDAKDIQGLTPLNKSLAEGKKEIAYELIRRGADASIGDNENTLPVHMAARLGDIDLYKTIASKGFDINVKDDNDVTPLFYSIEGKHPAMTKYLVENGADVNAVTKIKWPTLLYAAIYGPIETAQLLLDKKANVNAKSDEGFVPLHSAVSFGRTEIVKLFVEHGARVNETDNHGETPIFWALNPNTYDAAKYLIENGAKATWKGKTGRTPLMTVAGRGSVNVAELFLQHGVDINAIDSNGQTALHYAAYSRNPDGMSKFLILNGAEVNPLFCKHGKVSGCCSGITTPLHSASNTGQLAMVRNLINSGAKINVLNQDGLTPLYLAVKKGNPDVVKLLVEHGAFINTAEKNLGYSELMLAVALGKKDIADYLIKNGADVNMKNKEGKSALDLAWNYGHKQIAYSLLTAGGSDASLAQNISQPDLLTKPLGEKEAAVWFLGHSGWAVKTKNHLLVFDYYITPAEAAPPDSSLACGYINLDELKNQNVTVFSSHHHGDHYNKDYFRWKQTIKNIDYVMCFNPQDATADYNFIPIHGEKQVNGMNISVVKSTDVDGGFLVEADGLVIFHPGDLANRSDKLAKEFTDEIGWIAAKGKKIDLAFAPIRGCSLGAPNQVKLGVEYMVEKLSPVMLIPMHAGTTTFELKKFTEEMSAKNYPVKLKYVVTKGDHFLYGNGKEITGL